MSRDSSEWNKKRDVQLDRYQAFLLPNNHQVLIKMPAQCASFCLDHSDVTRNEKFLKWHCEKAQESRDVCRHAIEADNPDRGYRNLILNFPGYMQLSNAIYSPDESDGGIFLTMTPYTGSTALAGKIYPTLHGRITWKLHLVEAGQRIVEKQTVKSNVDDILAKCLAEGMNI
jgi:hypothetical protein